MRAPLLLAGPAAIVLAGCGAHRPDADLACFPLPEAAGRGGFVVALAQAVDADHAPLPRNESEAVLFALAYETLTEVDCAGRVSPGLAEWWEASADSLTWSFRLRRDGRRPPVDALAVHDSWITTRRLAREGDRPSWPWAVVRLGSVRAVEEDLLQLTTLAPSPDLPALLALPEFAVVLRARDAAPGAWPAGTGGRISDPEAPAAARRIVWEPAGRGGAIALDVRPGGDPRDLASSGADAFLSGEHGSFVAGLGEWVVSELPPSREYWLLTRPGSPGDSLAASLPPTDWTAALRTPAVPLRVPAIGAPPGTTEPPRGPVEVVYPDEDADAAALAARVVAASGSGAAVSRGLLAEDYRRALGEGGSAAYVVAVAPPPAPSFRRVQLETLAPWLDEGRAVPILAIRGSVATRAGIGGIAAGHDGTLRLRHAGWSAGSAP
jgi:hypothetical protein